jgi:hypothetical protein
VPVTGNISPGKLHDVIQIAMGWEDCHLEAWHDHVPAPAPGRPVALPVEKCGMTAL